MTHFIVCALCTIAVLNVASLAAAGARTCEDVIADAREKIMAQKHNVMGMETAAADDEAIIGAMLRGIGAVYSWTAAKETAVKCAASVLAGSERWNRAAEAVKEHRFNPMILMLGYPLMFEQVHKKLLTAKADVAESIGRNAVYDFATGNFGNYPVLREFFQQN